MVRRTDLRGWLFFQSRFVLKAYYFIRAFMQLKGFIPYTSHNTVKAKVFDFFKQAKADVIATIQAEQQKGERFSLTFDEYAGKNRRYMCINVHQRGAGLVRVWGSQTAATLKKIVDYSINFCY